MDTRLVENQEQTTTGMTNDNDYQIYNEALCVQEETEYKTEDLKAENSESSQPRRTDSYKSGDPVTQNSMLNLPQANDSIDKDNGLTIEDQGTSSREEMSTNVVDDSGPMAEDSGYHDQAEKNVSGNTDEPDMESIGNESNEFTSHATESSETNQADIAKEGIDDKKHELFRDVNMDAVNGNRMIMGDEHRYPKRYRDISFSPEDKLSPSFQNCEIVLRDSGIQGYAFGKRQVFLRHWHRPILQDLVSDKRKEMADEENTALSVSEATDLDSTYDVVQERGSTQNSSVTFGPIAVKASPVEEITVETAITNTPQNASTNNDTVSTTSSRQRVSEWIQQSEQAEPDVKIPPYDPGPPPVFTSQSSDLVSIVLCMRLWDRFQMIPRERISTSDTFRPFLRAFKFICYIFLFCIVLGSAVVSKICILIMTSSITKDPKALKDGDSPANTMLVISICFPYVCWVLSYSAKSLFGSSSWPRFKLVVVTLFVELLHSFGLCLLVFHILPRMDMARCLLNLCGIFTVPAFLKTISTAMDGSLPGIKRFTLAVLNGIAFLIQFGNLAATTMFSLPLSEDEKRDLLKEVIGNTEGSAITSTSSNITHSIERPNPTFGNRIMWEIPVSLFLISISYWENYVSSDFSICSLKIPLLEWKKQLHSVRQRLYIFAGIWKIGWTMVFAVLLLPGFSFNLEFTGDHHVNVEKSLTTPSPRLPELPPILTQPPPTVARNLVEDMENMSTTTLATTTNQSNSTLVGGGRTFVKRSISDVINNAISKGDFSSILNLTEDSLPRRRTPSPLPEGLTTTTTEPKPTKPSNSDKSTSNPSSLYIIELPESVKENFQRYGPLYAQMVASTLLSYFGSLACKLCMQTYGFTVPLFLATPITLGLVLAQCYTNFIPSYLYIWLCPESSGDLRLFHLLWLCVLWISQLIVTGHIWSPKNGRMAKIERLFVIPLRCGVLTDLSMMLRRRVNDRDFSLFNMEDDASIIYDDEEVHRADDVVPQIYACATMWHETRNEMSQLLKSLFRIDIDHSARYLAQRFYGIRDPDYYEFEAHIFFDDAMELSDDDLLVPNSFVAELIECIDDAISSVHERQMQLGPPIRTPTPYGGRLTWKLPGGTRLLVHLKDKHKIRHKKRWSQVMYMYYLLGYRILAQPENLLHRESSRSETPHSESDRVKLTDSQLRHRRQASHFTRSVIFNYTTEEVHTQAENTFILTLDGDVDFKPDAVRLLIDRLKKNKKVGAACGRIHPIGSGPILWYQEFEYAIGHWLQKATEHVFGCVLCAPGCFSLFRGSALMDDNVARTYAIRASEAGHYVQYDQGEDRWLSTLLLQQGYRIDYCAAADALTHAPETFSEFFNQRRRWGPSTLANIADLLGDWKNTVRLNDNISTPYVLYQFLLLVSTILGPATVLLMMAGAFTIVFKTSIISSYAIALVPPILFIIICTYAKPSTQITLATILSACYAIIMTVVLVGTVGTAIEGSLTSPNVIFLIMLVFIFFVAALMHPEEFACVIPGALYFICIPTGYLILTIYYLCNLHIVSWGTREVPKRKSKEQVLAEKRAEEEKKRKKEQRKGFLGWLGFSGIMNEIVEMFKQFRTMTLSNSEKKSQTDALLEELIYELRQTRDQKAPPRHRSSSTMTHDTKQETISEIVPSQAADGDSPQVNDGVPAWLKNEDPNNPGWLGDPVCGDGPVKQLEDRETIFWKQLLRKYLSPISEDRVHQEKVAADLKSLRNNVVFGFFMSSALWIALTMQLQLLQDDFKDTALFIKIPHFDPGKKDLTFEPLGMVFLALFSSILLFQFIGMLSHRWGTILHVLSITEVSCSQKFTERYKVQEIIAKAMELQRVSNIENEPEPDYDDPIPDYDDDDEFDDDEETLSSAYTDASLSTIISFSKPPSYHSNDVAKKSNFRRRNSAIFNRRGLATGRTLRKAFERRYRNQLRREKSGESNDSEGALAAGFDNV
ncbi:hypothetical protein FSP39_004615 [Pinctada imbricata]|uniref:chitin synthase n=1 Tax=Pinctada imbricata TaxID=66713 RepID=A0AA88Y233_PINIB|nr:hypothetical protein FSP39_004615 [Pinctada imbricata]